jgi:hypothetical protein
MSESDSRPFPIQGGYDNNRHRLDRSTIPWWLAEEAYAHYKKLFGDGQSLERIAHRGGFGREELLTLLRREDC